eukprot:XP_001695576.1 predicted protein [Chlamydomonas reinhardtii]
MGYVCSSVRFGGLLCNTKCGSRIPATSAPCKGAWCQPPVHTATARWTVATIHMMIPVAMHEAWAVTASLTTERYHQPPVDANGSQGNATKLQRPKLDVVPRLTRYTLSPQEWPPLCGPVKASGSSQVPLPFHN